MDILDNTFKEILIIIYVINSKYTKQKTIMENIFLYK